ncbi:MAG: 3-dehydroquinate synthase [Myxococcota bacterium]|jgi:3-dehydroquinate synthase
MTTSPNTLDIALGSRSYAIHFVAEPPAPTLAQLLPSCCPTADRALIVTDTNVGPLYGADVVDAVRAAGITPTLATIEAGEASKSLTTVSTLLDTALSAALKRGDVIIALGGGVVGDLAGFTASVLHRGVDFIQVPTSLLAQVDSSVGGKTGVNHATGKNLIGTFWQPRAVVTSLAVLRTLPPREVRCGLSEALKHGFIADASLVDFAVQNATQLRALEPAQTAELVRRCCAIKAEVVEADERDHGRRAVLNFGHTLGHAYERLLGYGALTHGEAVALGSVWAARLSEAIGVAKAGLCSTVVTGLEALGLPHDIDDETLPSLSRLIEAAQSDKKAVGDGVRFVLLEANGRATLRRLSWVEIQAALSTTDGRDGQGAR